jgi:alanyl-tRNA synthetase
MTSAEIRNIFLRFFEEKGHKIVPSAPIVLKNDPTLMFTNAGMNQFKDYFLGNKQAEWKRVADTQKCLRVTGKHNDLEDVGIDTYHHTMFEMLGNWSFGDYFKKDALLWAWELLTERYKLQKDRIYVTYFEGNEAEGVPADEEARDIWQSVLPADRVMPFGKKENFWEMGNTGPCGPCSEIHVDLRSNEEIKAEPGQMWVNQDHPQVIEIWNNVFIQYNRKEDGSLEQLPARHVDTGMGFERLVRVLQGKASNYDTDVFQPIIRRIEELTGSQYGKDVKIDVAIRVIADHIRAVTFAIADGQLPSNTGAGYVIRRILRRAVRYGYSALGMDKPFFFQLVDVLAEQFKDVFPEVVKQQDFLKRIIQEEEISFQRTLSSGIKMFDKYVSELTGDTISGKFAFDLYDTYGFPFDLTQLLAREKQLQVDADAFNAELKQQKDRSRQASAREEGDWQVVTNQEGLPTFLGYDTTTAEVKIMRYRRVMQKGQEAYHIVLDQTPFYPEGGGQIGDTGYLEAEGERVEIINTYKENDLIIHVTEKLPADFGLTFKAVVDAEKRQNTANNHSATHLMHAALRQVLGTHVAQKGSLVHDKGLRFDFSHFSKMTDEEIAAVEHIVNQKIRENITLQEDRSIPFKEAVEKGAMALFGEKYGDKVRMITFDPKYSVELCGGIHVRATGQLGYFKILSESAVAAGVRRIEAVTGPEAEKYISDQLHLLRQIREMLKNPKDVTIAIEALREQNKSLGHDLEKAQMQSLKGIRDELAKKTVVVKGNIGVIAELAAIANADAGKNLAFDLKNLQPDTIVVLGAAIDGKANLWVSVPEYITKEYGVNAGQIIKEISSEIQGGGGGAPIFASAGGKKPEGLHNALQKALEIINAKIN